MLEVYCSGDVAQKEVADIGTAGAGCRALGGVVQGLPRRIRPGVDAARAGSPLRIGRPRGCDRHLEQLVQADHLFRSSGSVFAASTTPQLPKLSSCTLDGRITMQDHP